MKKTYNLIVVGIWVAAVAIFGFLGFKVFVDRKLTAVKAVEQVLELRSQQDTSKLNALFTDDYANKPKRKGSLINTITYKLEYQKTSGSDSVTMLYGSAKNEKKMPIIKFYLKNDGNFFKYNWKVYNIEELDSYFTETVANILVEKEVQEISNKNFDVDGFEGTLISFEKIKADKNPEFEEDDYYLVKFKFSNQQFVKDKKIMAAVQDKDGECTSRAPIGLQDPNDGISEEKLYIYRDCDAKNIFMFGLINDNIKLNVE